jgi:hypothetical protein
MQRSSGLALPVGGVLVQLALWLALPLGLLHAVSVPAADGVLEINQTCAAGPGCFPGDAPGFPVEIFAAGGYRLTGSLSVPALQTGVSVFANDVTLDLGGFELTGALTCTGEGATLSCPGWIAAATRSRLGVRRSPSTTTSWATGATGSCAVGSVGR